MNTLRVQSNKNQANNVAGIRREEVEVFLKANYTGIQNQSISWKKPLPILMPRIINKLRNFLKRLLNKHH